MSFVANLSLVVLQGLQQSYIWAASNFICVVRFYFFIPEKKAHSLEGLDETFEAGIAARKFRLYECRIVEEAKQDIFRQEKVLVTKQAA
jgi:hypothetical protein